MVTTSSGIERCSVVQRTSLQVWPQRPFLYSGAMPTYEYRCERGHTFEVIQRMTDEPIATCETCSAPVQRVLHPVAVHFKGSGFYNTDYGKRRRGKAEAGEGGASSDSGSGEGVKKVEKSGGEGAKKSDGGEAKKKADG
jgi:putative FmdB family regulatory protein